MDLHGFEDTIAAVSTPPGRSGIGIVRLSGSAAVEMAEGIFRPANPKRALSTLPSYTIAYGHVVHNGETLDEAIVTVMLAPRTYTTQDVVEINCHGGMVPLMRTLEAVLACGARLADPGEFTKRAFLFGRIDLVQAESVADVINARTEEAQRAAVRQLEGGLSEKVNGFRDQLVDILARLEASIDFGDEDIELISRQQLTQSCANLSAELGKILDGAELGRALREGVRTAIVGRPNVGKSSLMNALLGHERVIVTPIPGTTRDVVEDTLNVEGVPLILADTAGLRDTDHVVEAAGVARTRSALANADLVLVVLDGSEPLTPADDQLIAAAPSEKRILVINKRDLPPAFEEGAVSGHSDGRVVEVSARECTGIEGLRGLIAQTVWSGQAGASGHTLVTNVRHKMALERAREAVEAGRAAAQRQLSEEYIASDLREALDALGEIVGVTLAQDVIDRIFETFCIGK